MGRHKRKHAEFANDSFEVAATNTASSIISTAAADSVGASAALTLSDFAEPNVKSINDDAQQREWQVSTSKKSKKKSKSKPVVQTAAQEWLNPTLTFPKPVTNPLRVKDLQTLVLYVLSDGVAPTWVALKNGKQIEHVVVLSVPGIDKEHLSNFASLIEETSELESDSPDGQSLKAAPPLTISTEVTKNGKGEPTKDSIKAKVRKTSPRNCIVPIKAPGESKTGRIHSSIQAMLISPEDKSSKGSYNGADHVFSPVQTPISHFVHTADELLEAEYPIHPAIFTNDKDGEWEKMRRETTGQTVVNGWVDSKVDISTPKSTNLTPDSSDLTGGLEVYALDCEMVLTIDEVYSLARVSVLDWDGNVVLDRLVKPGLPVKNYNTMFSGITEQLLEGVTTTLADIQSELSGLLTRSAILLGHSLESDFNAMKMTHPFVLDTSLLYPHPMGLPLRSSLKFLANKYLRREIQKGGEHGHDSVEDAKAVLDLVKLKCDKGPRFGAMDSNGESIFARLRASGCKTAIVEHGNPQKGLGKLASTHAGCKDDAEITESIINLITTTDPFEEVNFLFAQLRDMDKSKKPTSPAQKGATSTAAAGEAVGAASNSVEKERKPPVKEDQLIAGQVDENSKSQLRMDPSASSATVANLTRVYESLAPSTLFIVMPGLGDMTEVRRLQAMKKQYQMEFKVKKWNELSVQWGDQEIQALKKAADLARRGWGLVSLK